MQNEKASKILLILGIVLIAIGCVFASIGMVWIVRFAEKSLKNTMGWGESSVENVMESDLKNNVFTFLGVVLIVVGVVLIRIYKKKKLLNGEYHVLNESQKQIFDELSNKSSKKEGVIMCEYCGSIVDSTTLKCPSCGAKHKKNKD